MMTQASQVDGDRQVGVAQGAPLWLLRAEGAAVLVGASWAYGQTGQSWWLYALLFFVPDLAMLGYLRGARTGAVTYNIVHTYLVPLALLAVGWAAAVPLAVGVALVWIAHIGVDRAIGAGLKYPRAFKATHLSAG